MGALLFKIGKVMACPYRKEIKNKRYVPNNENKGVAPEPIDERQRLVGVGCGKCAVCKRKEVASWRVRLQMELEYNKRKVHFVTMTLNDEAYMELIGRDLVRVCRKYKRQLSI